MDNAFTNIEEEIDLSQYMPEGAILVADNKSIVVKAAIEKFQEKNISFNTKDIQIKNMPSGSFFDFVGGENLSIKAEGLSRNLKDITIDSFHPYIDLKGLALGAHKVKLHIEPPEGIRVSDIPVINITLKLNKLPPTQDEENNGHTEDKENSGDKENPGEKEEPVVPD